MAAMHLHWQRNGVKGKPTWARLPYWDWSKDTLLDYMHISKNNGHRARTMMGDLTENDANITNIIKEVSPSPNMTSVRNYLPNRDLLSCHEYFATFATSTRSTQVCMCCSKDHISE